MLLTTPTRVPVPVIVPTRVPALVSAPSVTSTPVTVPTLVPYSVTVPTLRPPTAEKIIATQLVTVVGSGVVRAIIRLDAQQSFVVLPAATVGVPHDGSNSAAVSGSATLTAVYTRTVNGTTTVIGSATIRATYTTTATQAIGVSGTAALGVLYPRTATQAITTQGTTSTAAFLPVDATQDITASGTGIVRVDGGMTTLTGQGSTEVTGSAVVREARQTPSQNNITVTGAATVTGVVLTGPATNTITTTGSATTRPVYTLTATQTIAVTEVGKATAALTATQAIAVSESAFVRPAYNLSATNSISGTESADISVAPSNIYRDDFNGTTLDAGWTKKVSGAYEQQDNTSWALNGSGELASNGNDNATLGRALPAAYTNLNLETVITNSPSGSYRGVGGVVYTDATLSLNSASVIFFVTIDGYWEIQVNRGSFQSGQRAAQSYPLTTRIEKVGNTWTFKFNGTTVYTGTISAGTARGIGVYQNLGSANNRITSIEAT